MSRPMTMNFDIRGIPEIRQILEEMAPKHAAAISRNTNYAIASEARKRMRALVPRDSGQLAKSLSVRNQRGTANTAIVYFKPSGYYWRFVEYGTRGYKVGDRRASGMGTAKRAMTARSAKPFVTPAIEQVRAALPEIAVTGFQKAMTRRINAELKKQAKR